MIMEHLTRYINSNLDGKTLAGKLLVFILFPIASVIWSFFDIRKRSSQIILFLYAALIGYCFTLNEATEYDSLRYVDVFDNIQLTFFVDFAEWITYSSSIKDFYLHTLSYVVSSFTSNYHFLFLAASLVFSFFCLKCLNFLTSQNEFKQNIPCICAVFLFFLSNSIININGFRFWTATWYVLWCTFNLIILEKRKFVIFLPFAVFFHSSMWAYCFIVVIYFLTRKNIKFWLILASVSIFISSLSILLLQNIESYLPEIFQRTIDKYAGDEYIKFRNSGTGWIWLENLFNIAQIAYALFVIFIISRKSRFNKLNQAQRNLFVFTLILYSFSLFTYSIPSFGSRFISMVYPLLSYFLIRFNNDKKIYKASIYIPMVWSFTALYTFLKMYLPLLPSGFFYSSLFSLIS